MKKNYIKSLVSLLIAGAAFTACSSDENIIEQPVNPTEPQVYTMVIKAAKGGDNTNTRALRPGTNGTKNTVDAYWSGNEKIDVVQNNVIIGTATAEPSANGETTITATFNSAPSESYHMFFYLGGTLWDYTNQVGLLTGTGSISEKYDYSRALLKSSNFWPSGNDIIVYDNVTLAFDAPPAAIVKFALVDKADGTTPINATKLNISDEGQDNLIQSFNDLIYNYVYGDITINSSGLTNTIYAALNGVYYTNLKLTAIASDEIFSISKSSAILNSGSYYEINVKMNKILSRLHSSNAEAVLAGGYTGKTYTEAEELAKECWKVAGGTVYVVYSASGYLFAPTVCYAYSDGTNTGTGTATSAAELAALYAEGNTAWFVEAAPQYTMAADATTDDKGKLICTAGHIHAYNADAECTATRVAKIIYIGTTGEATYTHGLALALEDVSTNPLSWDNSGSYNGGKTAAEWCSAWNTSKPVKYAGWLLASKDQWNYLLGTNGANGYEALRDGFESVGGTNMQSLTYWSSTEHDAYNAWNYFFYLGQWDYGSKDANLLYARACLVF